jgi:hypothetical protein
VERTEEAQATGGTLTLSLPRLEADIALKLRRL